MHQPVRSPLYKLMRGHECLMLAPHRDCLNKAREILGNQATVAEASAQGYQITPARKTPLTDALDAVGGM